jgi:hypothetical protein
MQLRRLTLDKAHDIAGVQVGESHGPIPEPIREKPTNERHVIDDRRSGEGARVAQVLRVRVGATLGWGQSTCGDLLGGDYPLTAQKIHEVPERGHITQARPRPPRPITEVPHGMLGADLTKCDSLPFQPITETCRE